MEKDQKSNRISDDLRAEGNQFYAQKKFYDALLKYNESLCFAEAESENLGLAYANRSALYYEMKLYDKCLQNIDLAKENRYPEKNFEILQKREEKCKELMKQQKNELKSDAWNFFKLSFPSNKKLPFIAECLEMKNDNKYGRYIITNQPLKVGNIISIEEPVCKILQRRFVFERCALCLKDDLLCLIPCEKCNKTMFCRRCLKDAQTSFHQFECPLIDFILSGSLISTFQMALRTFFVALSNFDGSIENLEKFFNENSVSRSVFDFDESIDLKEKLLAVNSLVTSDKIGVDTAVFEKILLLSPALSDMMSSHYQFIMNFLKKQTQIGTLNYHEIYEWPLKKGGFADDELNEFKESLAYKRGAVPIGNGSFPFTSLLNHSCSPNVSRVFVDAKIMFVVLKPLEKGDQLFDDYGYNFTNVPRNIRQVKLQKQYKFKCQCQACEKDWSLLPSLKVHDKSCLNKAKKISRELSLAGLNQKKAFEKFREVCDTLQKGYRNYPSLELCSLEQSFSAFCEMISKPGIEFP